MMRAIARIAQSLQGGEMSEIAQSLQGAEMSGIVKSLQGSQLCASKIHLRWKP